ncbi:MAG: hypothetical protein GXY65_18235 [Rhodococcus sp.]|uniref:hypothetical protein n=1 Tax=Rhodococcus sp. TaxID=1831 RepID=UPI0016BB93CF|nr:hypothetical protein [Rhodococcus sp. (in: high G+C Gram-positive bacteria)]NLV81239.1 hypothetical protein [Rhodococcus sp. (in: high G+C Gram-positive bacteria)]
MVAAFLDMDRRQSVAELAVAASHDLEPQRGMRAQWDPIRSACYDAAGHYLQLARSEPGQPLQPAAAYQQATQRIAEATRLLDRFYNGNRAHLEHATALAQTAPQLAQHARTSAAAALAMIDAPEHAAYTHYPSVVTAVHDLDDALRALDTATGAGTIRDRARAAEEASAALHSALAQAPGRDAEARNAVASVTTRTGAVRTRTAQLAPAYSALLREFNAASSADLTDNDTKASALVDAAETGLDEARAALREGHPEVALERVAAVRGELSVAEDLVDAVTGRLATLRAIRENPQAKVDEVRFRLRDAQHLAVQRGLTAEWGSVLDAQLDRIDRAVDALTGVHPDYWAYARDLDAVADFIAGVVARMRGRTEHA